MNKNETLKLALDDLMVEYDMERTSFAKRVDEIFKQALAAPVQDSTCNNSLREQGKAYPRTCKKCKFGPCIALANLALDKKAENARELGLDYEPVQEPLEYWNAVEGWVKIDEVREHFESVGCGTIYKTAGDGRVPLTAAQRQPVDLTNDEINNIANGCHLGKSVQSAIREALDKYKEKNT
jgi:hypothetical protein